MITEIILATTKHIPAVIPHLRGRAGLVYCEHKSLQRDANEPLRAEKEKDEERVRRVIMRRFRRQMEKIANDIHINHNKTIMAGGVFVDDDGSEAGELIKIVYNAILTGVAFNELNIGFALADGSVNEPALLFSQRYVTEWLKSLDETSEKAVRAALSTFISQPGATLGDVMKILEAAGFNETRAMRIAITEITRVYAEANQIYGFALKQLYPNYKVTKEWFTNVDDRVCPICKPLDGKRIDINESFKGIGNPPAHVNCSCWTAVTVKI